MASDPTIVAPTPVAVTIESNGDVRVDPGSVPGTVAFDGITFKAGG